MQGVVSWSARWRGAAKRSRGGVARASRAWRGKAAEVGRGAASDLGGRGAGIAVVARQKRPRGASRWHIMGGNTWVSLALQLELRLDEFCRIADGCFDQARDAALDKAHH